MRVNRSVVLQEADKALKDIDMALSSNVMPQTMLFISCIEKKEIR